MNVIKIEITHLALGMSNFNYSLLRYDTARLHSIVNVFQNNRRINATYK